MHSRQLQPCGQLHSRNYHQQFPRFNSTPFLLSFGANQRSGSASELGLLQCSMPGWSATRSVYASPLSTRSYRGCLTARQKPRTSANAASAAAAATAAGTVASSSDSTAAAVGVRAAAQQKSLEVLEWRSVCRQVACFCGTSMASEQLQAGLLHSGSSKAESELLLQQTAEAVQANLQVSGVFDLRPALEAAAAGGILNARQLEGVATSMESAFQLKAAAAAAAVAVADAPHHHHQHHQQQQQQYLYPSLAQLASEIQDRELRTLQAIRSCISDASVLSEASPGLAAVREARRANKDQARALATQIAKDLFTQGAAEGREPLLQRGRYCVALKRSRRSAVSKGSVKLGESGTGATLYIEPAELLELNNREAQLADQESQAELAVLQALSQFLAERGDALQGMLAAVTQLDMVAARAKHAQWCDGLRPVFLDSSSRSSSTSPLHLPGARHPLLLQPSLPPLPRPPSSEDGTFATDFVPPPQFAFATATTSSDSESDDEVSAGGGKGVSQGSVRTAKPLDIRVPGSATVVAITGPNTGGKTVTLKTAGLLALMARAGLYLPCDRQELAAAAAADDSNGSSSSSSDLEQPRLLWFDQVLADIGDSQSLQQNLSTFSGHIARLKLLLGAAGQQSLVLLDEVGSGTDPLEGSALARAVLDVLAGQACLTLATSHHAELKTAADEDARYVNVSLEFNTLTLQPTYRLLWGSAGSSNALDIATALGFDSDVLADARILARAELGRQEEQQGRMEQVAASVEDQLAAARASIIALNIERQQRERDIDKLQDAFRQMLTIRGQLRSKEKLVVQEAAEAVIKIQQAAVRSRQGSGTLEDVQSALDYYAGILNSVTGSSAAGGLKPGDEVVVPSMGVLNPFTARIVKVSDEYVWLEDNQPLFGSSKSKPLKFRIDQVVPSSQLQVPVAGPSVDDLLPDREQQQQQPQNDESAQEQHHHHHQQQQQQQQQELWG